MKFSSLLRTSLLLVSIQSVAATTTLECTYSIYSDSEGVHETRKPFTLTFISDSNADKHYMLGNAGTEEVYKIRGARHVSFIETTASGNVTTTTITDALGSTHSRSTVIAGDIVPSQYYGNCKRNRHFSE